MKKSIFESMINAAYVVLSEAEPTLPTPPSQGGDLPLPPADSGGGMPPPDAGATGEQQPPEEVDPKEEIEKIRKASQKDWDELAYIVASVIKDPFSEPEIMDIEQKMKGITLKDFINSYNQRYGQESEDALPDNVENLKSNAVMIFDIIKKSLDRKRPSGSSASIPPNPNM